MCGAVELNMQRHRRPEGFLTDFDWIFSPSACIVDFAGVMKAHRSKKLRSQRDVHLEKGENRNLLLSSLTRAIVLISKPL